MIVIGGSFGGQSAAMQLARARQRVLLIDAGEPRNRFADAAHGFLGQDGRTPHAIMREATCQLLAYPTLASSRSVLIAVAAIACSFRSRLVLWAR